MDQELTNGQEKRLGHNQEQQHVSDFRRCNDCSDNLSILRPLPSATFAHHLLTVFVSGLILLCAATPAYSEAPVRISLRTTNGHYLVASDASRNYEIRATATGVGYWETLTVESVTGESVRTIRSGDRIRLRTFHGRYLMARNNGGGDLTGEATKGREWETFIIEKVSGGGPIEQGDRVTLRANNNTNFVMAVDGGGRDVTVSSSQRAAWETLTVEFENARLVRLRTFRGSTVAASGGGGDVVLAAALSFGEWRTFTLLNATRRDGFMDGDEVALQTFSGNFISAEGGGGGALFARANRREQNETFTIRKTGGGAIGPSDAVWFETANGRNFLMAVNGGGGLINAASSSPREWETFTLEPAENRPTPAGTALSGVDISAGYPFAPGRARLSGTRNVATFLIGFRDKPVDTTIANSDIRDFIHGEAGSIAAWMTQMSNGALRMANSGTFGPMTVPWNYGDLDGDDQDYWRGIMQLAEARGFNFASQDINGDGRVTNDELQLVILDCTDFYNTDSDRNESYGASSTASIEFSYSGKTYLGRVFNVGLNIAGHDVQGPDQLAGVKATVLHELSHVFLNTPDRYEAPFPPRGDVLAIGTNRGGWETFAFARTPSDRDASDIIGNGRRVRLRNVAGDDFLVADGSPLAFLNRGGPASDALGEFIVELPSRGDLRHGERVSLRSAVTRRYVMAKNGGGDVVQVVAGRPSTWEQFIIEKRSGDGLIRFGDPFVLTTSSENPFNERFLLFGVPNGRKTDAETLAHGWWAAWGVTGPGEGPGGKFDIMASNKRPGFLSPYDRFIRGWLTPKVLLPGNRACYALSPTADRAEAFILWDPTFPDEWYTIENRQHRADIDEVPSNGTVISWVNEKPEYWARWNVDGNFYYPAVISAAAPLEPPNMHVKRTLLPGRLYKRTAPDAAFRSGTHVLPRGEGDPSRFTLSFGVSDTSESTRFCLR